MELCLNKYSYAGYIQLLVTHHLLKILFRKERNMPVSISECHNIKHIFGVTVEDYFNRTLQFKYTMASTGEPV